MILPSGHRGAAGAAAAWRRCDGAGWRGAVCGRRDGAARMPVTGAFRTMTGAAGYARLLFDRLFPKRKNAGSRQKSQEKPVKSCANSR